MRRARATSVRSRPHETAPARRGGASPRAEAEEEGLPGQECAWERAQPARLPEEAGRDAEDERGHPEGLAGQDGRGRVAGAPHARPAASPPRTGRPQPLTVPWPRWGARDASRRPGVAEWRSRSSSAFREQHRPGRETGFLS